MNNRDGRNSQTVAFDYNDYEYQQDLATLLADYRTFQTVDDLLDDDDDND